MLKRRFWQKSTRCAEASQTQNISAWIVKYRGVTRHATFLPRVGSRAQAGTIDVEEYVEDGTHVVAYVPTSLRNRLEKAATSFSDERPLRERPSSGL